jgi:predicted transglutaminase-like cysteine proteinase
MPLTTRAHARARLNALALAFLSAIIAGSADDAVAKHLARKPPATALALVETSPVSSVIGALARPPAPPAPATFFTINQVLAKLSGLAKTPSPLRFAAVDAAATMTDAPPASLPAEPLSVGDEPFKLVAFRAPEGVLWVKWRGVEADIAREAGVIARCRAEPGDCTPAAARFVALVDDASRHEGREKIATVNRAVNTALQYMSDYAQHGVADLWSAPLASFASGRGDCEDYAIAKYVALRDAGFPAEDLRLLLVRDRSVHEDHAVLAARHHGRWLILDNRFVALVEDSEARNLSPLFAIDYQGVKLLAAPYVRREPESREGEIAPAATDWGTAASTGGGTLSLLL